MDEISNKSKYVIRKTGNQSLNYCSIVNLALNSYSYILSSAICIRLHIITDNVLPLSLCFNFKAT